ncbi:hypothetical protein G6O69_16705 [Pseudenhygromyxa sp. WMMC2535]|uniref:hypothetical protein n=1 Tax=Pseudenhygromyxa sp. WMMC2535 TaxID=2712867 RepID=UPI001595C7EE|nr:hypothetical protein [Pseudenhygromyxa sp. WMMC2535]NVB39485.1 hypothetical protein [Pseudenhygromyxa sp. WMMC2535]
MSEVAEPEHLIGHHSHEHSRTSDPPTLRAGWICGDRDLGRGIEHLPGSLSSSYARRALARLSAWRGVVTPPPARNFERSGRALSDRRQL